ncbi:MAG: hypothetical protein ACXWEY_02020 [Bacteroidia bacterium]
MSEYKLPALEITASYTDAADISELIKNYNPHIISVINSHDSVFDIVSPEATLNIPEIAKFIIEHENPEQAEAEILALLNANDFSVGTRIIKTEEELTEGEIEL